MIDQGKAKSTMAYLMRIVSPHIRKIAKEIKRAMQVTVILQHPSVDGCILFGENTDPIYLVKKLTELDKNYKGEDRFKAVSEDEGKVDVFTSDETQ